MSHQITRQDFARMDGVSIDPMFLARYLSSFPSVRTINMFRGYAGVSHAVFCIARLESRFRNYHEDHRRGLDLWSEHPKVKKIDNAIFHLRNRSAWCLSDSSPISADEFAKYFAPSLTRTLFDKFGIGRRPHCVLRTWYQVTPVNLSRARLRNAIGWWNIKFHPTFRIPHKSFSRGIDVSYSLYRLNSLRYGRKA